MKVNLLLGKGIVRTIETDDYTSEVRAHALHKGFENIVKDTHASFTKKSNPTDWMAKSIEAVDKKLAALAAGDLRVARTAIDIASHVNNAIVTMSDEEFEKLVALRSPKNKKRA